MADGTPRVALFLPTLRGGGAERVMVNLAHGFSQRGVHVDVVLAEADGVFLSRVPPGAQVFDLGVKSVYRAVPGLARYLRRRRPDALLSALTHANLVAVLGRLIAHVPVRTCVAVHSTLSVEVRETPGLKGRVIPGLASLLYRRADRVIAVSEGVADDLARCASLPREKIKVIYNPVVTPDLLARAEEPLDHPWFSDGEPPVVLSVGRLTAAKDHATLIRAFALVRRERVARLVILGEGNERRHLEALAGELGLGDDVALPGFVENPYTYMRRARVFVLSSRWEGLPTVLVEALAVGTPVVSTDCPSGPREILEGGRWGRLVPVGDVDALATAILVSLDEPGPLPGAAERMVERFGLDAVVEQYRDVLGLR